MKWNSKRRTYNMKKKSVGSWFADYKNVKFFTTLLSRLLREMGIFRATSVLTAKDLFSEVIAKVKGTKI